MKSVQPITDDRIVEGLKHYFRVRSMRDYLFFSIGIYSGLRVSDLCKLRVVDVRGTHVGLTEQKNKNTKRFIIHPSIRNELDIYISSKSDSDYLFASRQRKKISQIKNQPIDRTTAYRFLNVAAAHFGIKEIGCHTLRKTWGYRLYKQDERNLALLMEAYGHSDMRVTLRYIGITQNMLDRAIMMMK
ncbi:tyrosine-type recombinase/integrase [Paenibacillus sinopodophylli]|uniref:tyrosine-type recombinase/integrase n=1 Tax=Paenibacillus sinopodophylli TaxID=1837342 RepID=UPI00110CBC5A|nr:tyrosine-type recombinase/integrase [Paenibacillus sinopodophylli]